MSNEQYREIMDRLDLIEFRQELLFTNTDIDRSIFEYGLTRIQYQQIMNLMDKYREKIDRGEHCSHAVFETEIYGIVPEHHGDYHMCEELSKGFMDEGRWEEVFMDLYGNMPKYSYLKKEQ